MIMTERRRARARGRPIALIAALLMAVATAAQAQDIEPRSFSNAPVGVNFLVGGYAYTRGGVSADPAVPLTGAQLETSSAFLAYSHVLDLWGMSAKVDAALPYTWLSGSATFAGQPVERVVHGPGDAAFRVSVNFYGAPALSLREFQDYHQDLILGARLTVTAPVGQYDSSRLVNLSTNRWSFRPELGASQALGRLTLELSGAVTFYTDNTNFLNGRTRSQAPIASIQGHAIYSFRSGIWASADATYFTGGRTAVDGTANDDRQSNWRLGATLSMPLGRRYSVKVYASTGVAARTHNNFDLIGIALQYRWGGGL
jgi:hypothetical protein